MTITIHRGINQIGGCITEIASTKGTKIMIDLGHNLPEGDEPSEDKYDNNANLSALLDGVKAVFYTHPHGDHVGFEVEVAKRGIDQYIGCLSKELMILLKGHLAYSGNPKFKAELEAFRNFRTFEAKKKIGDNCALVGGFPTDLLGRGTPEECSEYTKKLIDTLGEGGGYILTTDKMISYRTDCRAENLKAVNETAFNYKKG